MREYHVVYSTSTGAGLDFNVHAVNRSDAIRFFRKHYRKALLVTAKETKASKIEQRMLKKAAKAKAAEPVPVLTEQQAFNKILDERRREWEANPSGAVAIIRYLQVLLCVEGSDKGFKQAVKMVVTRAANVTTR